MTTCVACGKLPADECFTVCGPCWDKEHQAPQAERAPAGDEVEPDFEAWAVSLWATLRPMNKYDQRVDRLLVALRAAWRHEKQ